MNFSQSSRHKVHWKTMCLWTYIPLILIIILINQQIPIYSQRLLEGPLILMYNGSHLPSLRPSELPGVHALVWSHLHWIGLTCAASGLWCDTVTSQVRLWSHCKFHLALPLIAHLGKPAVISWNLQAACGEAWRTRAEVSWQHLHQHTNHVSELLLREHVSASPTFRWFVPSLSKDHVSELLS